MKYDWSSRNAATVAMISLISYYSWRGISGRMVIFAAATNIAAIAIASWVGGKNLRRRLAVFVLVLCILASMSFFTELRCNPRSICTALSVVVLAINIGSLCFLLKPAQIVRIEV